MYKISRVLPLTILVIFGFFSYRSYWLFVGLTNLVASRKPEDAKLLGRLLSSVSQGKNSDPLAQIPAMQAAIENSHRSTRVLISDSPGSYAISNSVSVDKAIVPDSVSNLVLRNWVDNLQGSLFGAGYTFSDNGDTYHVVARSFPATIEDRSKGKVEKKVRQKYVILITNLDRSVAKFYTETLIELWLVAVGVALTIAIVIRSLTVPVKLLSQKIRKGDSIELDNFWPEETKLLAQEYNNFLEEESISNTQIQQSTSGQMLVIAEHRLPAIISRPNSSLATLTGYSIAKLEGMELNKICPVDVHQYHLGTGVWDDAKGRYVGTSDYPRGCPHHGAAKSEIVGRDRTVDVIAKDGSIRKATLGVYLISSSNDRHLYAGVLTDVTRIVESKEEIEQLYRSLRHDIIINCKGTCDMFALLEMSGFVISAEHKTTYELAVAKANIAYQLVSNTGRLGEDLKIREVNTGDVISQLQTIFSTENVIFESNESIVKIDTEAFILRVATNIINNAIKYSDSMLPIEVGFKIKDSTTTFYCKDRGVGMTDEDAERILSNYGASARLNPEIPGSGTGLHTAKRILKKHGLELELKSKVGSGSIFFVKIPIYQTL